MKESGGRRIKRDIIIKTSSIKFADDDLIKENVRNTNFKGYIKNKASEIEIENNKNKSVRRKLTNVGCFRIYIKKYLENSKHINKNMTINGKTESKSNMDYQ